jgi:phosphoribosylamine--glycine ligase
MKLLVVGSGGREHALCWRLSRSPSVGQILCAPGNPGTATVATNVPVDGGDLAALVALAREERVDLTVVGPEAPLCAGIAERFAAEGLLLAGPSAEGARLEGSKAFAKEFMERHGIPTARFGVFDETTRAEAMDFIGDHLEALVVKADGLAAGKGVYVCDDGEEAKRRVAALLAGELGNAGRKVVVEERLRGEEASFIVLTDGERIQPLQPSQDHKAAFDGDRGPNTGGMGAYSPAPVLDDALQQQVLSRIVEPTVRGMADEGTRYRGFLYVGLMVVDGQARVLEYNCRLGDPEAQPLMARLDDDLGPYLEGMARGELPARPLRWDPRAALCVVMASGGYPGQYGRGMPIQGIEDLSVMDDVVAFQAGTAMVEGKLVVAGGRVLGVTALGVGIEQAQSRAYEAVHRIHWDAVHFRRDIGYRALRSGPGAAGAEDD